jgi:hypothetical protein
MFVAGFTAKASGDAPVGTVAVTVCAQLGTALAITSKISPAHELTHFKQHISPPRRLLWDTRKQARVFLTDDDCKRSSNRFANIY